MKRFEELEKEAARLEHQIGAGLGYNPRTTRILQLKDNPSAQDYAIRSEKLKALVAENEALLAHIKKLSGASPDNTKAEAANGERDEDEDEDGDEDPPSDSPFFQTIANLRSENQELSKQLKDLGKMMLRYKKEWKWKVVELREVIGSIMGYRLDFLPNGSVRCTSVYAADPGESFVFNSGDDNKGNMKLYGGGNKEYLNSCMNQIRFWIQERGSIPGFMASLTLQNFEDRQKDLKPK
ncbi:coiled-coil domain-containing protein mad1 [Linderina macrospora]|uniref:Coiled-coil domain-containing protein mad1 n=1 Tax=Linderina macrospora TaxID=4868 RepID=A0ACC1IYU2_9FUNG|nr:coiled-coil domain-containing protein mad1 [Linderina macrospora]